MMIVRPPLTSGEDPVSEVVGGLAVAEESASTLVVVAAAPVVGLAVACQTPDADLSTEDDRLSRPEEEEVTCHFLL